MLSPVCTTTLYVFLLSTFVFAADEFSIILPFNETCMSAKLDYWNRNTDVRDAVLDPVWHFQDSGNKEGRTWTFGLCTPTSIFPNNTICNCPSAQDAFVSRYTWLQQTADTSFGYWLQHQTAQDGGISWRCEYCFNTTAAPPTSPPPPKTHFLAYECTCLDAGWDYLQRYPDVVTAKLDPVFHYQNSGWGENRLWECSLCNAASLYPNNSICNCTDAARNFTNTYTWDKGVTLATAFVYWQNRSKFDGEVWHCELCIPKPEPAILIRDFSAGLSGGLGAIIGLGALLGLFSAAMIYLYWDAFQKHGSFYCSIINCGVMVSYVAALVLLPPPTDALCVAFPWFLGIAFILVYGCLFVKTWVLYRVWQKAVQYKRSSMTPSYIMKGIGIAMAVEVSFLIIWTIIDPPKVQLTKMVDGTYEKQCGSDSIAFWIVFLSVKGAWLIFGVSLSILTRKLVKEYNESSSIAYAIYNDIALAIVAAPLAIILGNVPGGQIVIEVATIVLAFTFTMCILFFDIWYSVFFQEKDVLGDKLKAMVNRHGSSGNTGSTLSSISIQPI